jgi:hypothetical protein
MNTIDSDRASKIRARILSMANQVLQAYTLTMEDRFSEARVIMYDIDRFEISSIHSELFEFEEWRKEEQNEK